jgi:hypothetical protein
MSVQARRPSLSRIVFAWEELGHHGLREVFHLHDRQFGGSDEPLNFAPLCVLCHLSQPACRTRAEGIAFVNSLPVHQPLLWLVQMVADDDRALLRPGRERAKQRMFAAYETAVEAVRKAQLESATEPGITGYMRALAELLHPECRREA